MKSFRQHLKESTLQANATTNSPRGISMMGDGISLTDTPPPTKYGKNPSGKGKRVGLGWVTTPKDFKAITDIIKNAGIKIDDKDDPRSVLKALNQAKLENQQKLADELATKLGTSIGRPDDAISDVKQAIIQYDKAKAEFSKHTEKIADRIYAINKSVTEKRWKNPDGFNKSNASKYVAWDIKETGEEHETANSVPAKPETSPYPRPTIDPGDVNTDEDIPNIGIVPGDVTTDEDFELDDTAPEKPVGPVDRFARWLYSQGFWW